MSTQTPDFGFSRDKARRGARQDTAPAREMSQAPQVTGSSGLWAAPGNAGEVLQTGVRPARNTRILRRAVGIVVLAAYVGLFAEFFIRLFSPAMMMPRYVAASPYGIRVNKPNCTYWHRTVDYEIRIHTNSRGARADEDIPYEKPPGKFRVVALGDSFTIGYGVSLDDTFLSRMANELQQAGLDCEIVNLSVSGHSTTEELILLQAEGIKYQPDIVLVGWHGTDLDGNTQTNLYRLVDGNLVRTGAAYLPGTEIQDFLFSVPFYRFVAENSHLYGKVRESASDLVHAALRRVRMTGQWLRRLAKWFAPTQVTPRGVAENERATRYDQELSLALLKEMQEVTRRVGGRLLILDIPRQVRGNPHDALLSTLPRTERNDLDVYNPAVDLSAYPMKRLFWEKSCGHFTPFGCQIVGSGLARHILEKRMSAIESAPATPPVPDR